MRVHFWPFDGWDIPQGNSAIAEVYPALWSRNFAREDGTGDQHDAYSIAAWLSHADRDGSLAGFLKPNLTAFENSMARVEGWILGVPGLIREEDGVRLTKLTSNNQLTLPESVVSEFPGIEYFDVVNENGRIVLTPVNPLQADTVRAKLAALGVTDADITDAVARARKNE